MTETEKQKNEYMKQHCCLLLKSKVKQDNVPDEVKGKITASMRLQYFSPEVVVRHSKDFVNLNPDKVEGWDLLKEDDPESYIIYDFNQDKPIYNSELKSRTR